MECNTNWTLEKMAIRPIFFKEICFTISLKNRLGLCFAGNPDLREENRRADSPLLR
jgi:hypothetical protein